MAGQTRVFLTRRGIDLSGHAADEDEDGPRVLLEGASRRRRGLGSGAGPANGGGTRGLQRAGRADVRLISDRPDTLGG